MKPILVFLAAILLSACSSKGVKLDDMKARQGTELQGVKAKNK